MQDCELDDVGLKWIGGRRIFDVKTVQITGNYFTHKGIGELTRALKGNEELR